MCCPSFNDVKCFSKKRTSVPPFTLCFIAEKKKFKIRKAIVNFLAYFSQKFSILNNPYRVTNKFENNNYKIEVANKKKTYHINMLKPWNERQYLHTLVENPFGMKIENGNDQDDLISSKSFIDNDNDPNLMINDSLSFDDKMNLENIVS